MKFIVLFILSIFVIGCGNEKELSLALDYLSQLKSAELFCY